jgi:FAD/FMN-containing dehydrogenase
MPLKEVLASIVGSEHVSDDPGILEKYSKDYSFVQPRKPRCVVMPQNREEVQEIVKYASIHLLPLTPRSSGISFYGAGIPYQGGIVVDLFRMNKILEVDGKNKRVKIEPGVTWAQVQKELEKEGLMVCNPLLPHPSKSVLTSSMEREPILIPKSEYNETFLTAEMVLSNGEPFWTGSAIGKAMKGRGDNFPDGFLPSTRTFLGAQGTLGIMTWGNIKAEFLPSMEKVFFVPFEKQENLVEFLYRMQRRMIGRECFVLNNVNMAAILAEKWPEEFKEARSGLPRWIVILSLAGLHRLPQEKIEYEEEALMDVAKELHINVLPTVCGIPGLEKKVSRMLRKPWSKDGYWKFAYKGGCQDVFFHTTMDKAPEFTSAMYGLAAEHGYPTRDIGFYLQPIEYGRVSLCQYSFYYDPNDAKDVDVVKKLYLEASERVIRMGGLFTTPYGPWADMIYKRTSAYTAFMKVIKNAFDPINIMNPGKLCF